MNLSTRFIRYLLVEIALILLFLGLSPQAIDSIRTGSENAFNNGLLMLSLLFLIIFFADLLYKIITGKEPLPVATDNNYTEFTVAKLITKSLAFLVAAIFTTILPVLLISAIVFLPEYTLPVMGELFFYDSVRAFSGFIYVIWLVITITFSVLILQIFGLLLIGEFLQRQFTKTRHNLIMHMLKNIIIALPYIVLYSIAFVFVTIIATQTRDSSRFNRIAIIAFLYSFLTALKYYIYANLSAVAIEDKYNFSTHSSSIQYVKSYSVNFVKTFSQSISVSITILLYLIVLWVWVDRIPMLDTDAFWNISLAVLGILLAWVTFVEQMLFMLKYIRTKHPYYDIDAFISGKLQ